MTGRDGWGGAEMCERLTREEEWTRSARTIPSVRESAASQPGTRDRGASAPLIYYSTPRCCSGWEPRKRPLLINISRTQTHPGRRESVPTAPTGAFMGRERCDAVPDIHVNNAPS